MYHTLTITLLAGALGFIPAFQLSAADSEPGKQSGAMPNPGAQYGGKDFYPSSEYPVGFRGDGTGYFPGATPVTNWVEGTLKTVTRPRVPGQWSEKIVPIDDKGTNIVWKTEMPGWVNSQPIVVGDRVFTYAEPDRLVCVDANTGKIRWTAVNNPYLAAGITEPLATTVREMAYMYHVLDSLNTGWREYNARKDDTARYYTIMVDTVLPRMRDRLKTMDPDGNWDTLAATHIEAFRQYLTKLKTLKEETPQSSLKEDFNKLKGASMQGVIKGRIDILCKSGKGADSIFVPLSCGRWGNMVGWQMSVPVSDGRYVYASFGESTTACYDLDGRLVWAKHYALPNKSSTDTVQSPLLVGDILVDMHGGDKTLRGLDTKTGAMKWEAPTQGDFAFGKGSGYFVGSHKVVRLVCDGKLVDVIVTSLCNIIRASDGKILGVLPFTVGGACGGPSISNSGDIVWKATTGDAVSTPYIAYRLKFDGPDKVTATEIWRRPRVPAQYCGLVTTPKFCVFENTTDPQTGNILSPSKLGSISNILAGNTLIWMKGESSWENKRGDDGLISTTFFTADLTDPAKPIPLADMNILGSKILPRCVEYEKYAPELLADETYWGSWGARPFHACYSDTVMFPSGNRLFIRTLAHLYCIGDPKVSYDWNASSRPKDVTAGLAK